MCPSKDSILGVERLDDYSEIESMGAQTANHVGSRTPGFAGVWVSGDRLSFFSGVVVSE